MERHEKFDDGPWETRVPLQPRGLYRKRTKADPLGINQHIPARRIFAAPDFGMVADSVEELIANDPQVRALST